MVLAPSAAADPLGGCDESAFRTVEPDAVAAQAAK